MIFLLIIIIIIILLTFWPVINWVIRLYSISILLLIVYITNG
uniref:DUF3397 domain-containing protein n=1 Tax=Schistosoma curassoni TaxID=6186 RepID=A0A183JDS2_9TREM